jgi:phospholipid/cholesterol/gamma-HCH transport system substrate-binding protein
VNYAVVGAFVLALAIALIAGALWLASGGAFRKQYDLYRAYEEESVDGLSVNAPIKYNGVDIGKVRAIVLDPKAPQRVQLVFAIERGTPIKVDTLAVLKTQGLTGIAYVELSGGAPQAALLQAAPDAADGQYPVIRTKPSLGARLENVLTAVLAKLDSTSNNVNALLSNENRAAFSSALTDIAAVAHTIAARKDTLDAGIVSAARTFDNSAQATAKLEPVLKRIGSAADAVEKMGKDVALAGTNAGKTVDAVGTNMNQLANGLSTETLPELQRLLGELNVLAASLRRLSENTERGPASLLFGHNPVPDGPGEAPARAAGDSARGERQP